MKRIPEVDKNISNAPEASIPVLNDLLELTPDVEELISHHNPKDKYRGAINFHSPAKKGSWH